MALPAHALETSRPKRVYYPTSDGRPMAESDKHADQMVYCKEALRFHFADRPDVYVAGNNLLYGEEGNPRKVVSPDVYVVFGREMRQRDLYKVWEEEGHTPDVVIEITSKTTAREDTDKKLPLYGKTLNVSEYYRFDPVGDYLDPRLQGAQLDDSFRRSAGKR